MKEIKEDLNIQKDIPYSRITRQYCWDGNTPQLDLEIEYNPIRIPADFFVDTDKLTLKLRETQGSQNSQNNLEKEEQSWRIHTFRF